MGLAGGKGACWFSWRRFVVNPFLRRRSNRTNIFTIQNQEILLLHGIIKKSRAAPKHELDLARKRLLIYLKANL